MMARTDNDTWDLASSVGATATAVAASRAVASQGPDALLDDPFAEPLVRAVGLDAFVKMVDGESFNEDDPWMNRKTMSEQIAVRTRFFDDFFTAASEAGIRQAVILAAGLATEHMDMSSMPDDWAQKLDERSRRAGSDLKLTELFYSGDRNTAGAYLSSHRWHVTIRSTVDAFAANGFELPDDELTSLIGNSGYLTATLEGA
jgi:O-methyltransferase involved in polyketide biosynthesis